jgi:hypothetical protein
LDRFRDYGRFAVCFAGLGYLALWPLAGSGDSGRLFGAPLVCAHPSFRVLDTLCRAAHPLTLPPALHAVGVAAALFALLWLALRALRRLRPPRSVPTISVPPHLMRPSGKVGAGAAARAGEARVPRRPRFDALSAGKSRAHFGLRGTPP